MAAPDDFVERLAERIAGSTRASAVFGKPVERGGVTVIPVARARWAFGGGGGSDGEQRGSGGGGGGIVSPVGYIEVRKSGVEFKPIRDWRMIALVLTGVLTLAGLVTRRAVRRG